MMSFALDRRPVVFVARAAFVRQAVRRTAFACALLLASTVLGSAALANSTAEGGAEETSSASVGSPSAQALASYDGNWRRVSDEAFESSRILSIDTATGELAWIVRKMASGMLKRSTAPPALMQFSWDGQKLHQQVFGQNGQFLRPVDFDGPPQEQIDERGDPFTSTWVWTPDGLQINWTQAQAYGSNLYRIDERDQSLVVEHRIHVTAISGVAPIVYQSKFGRDGLPSVASGGSDSIRDQPVSQETR